MEYANSLAILLMVPCVVMSILGALSLIAITLGKLFRGENIVVDRVTDTRFHRLKTDKEFFGDVMHNLKCFEIRKYKDRDFRLGDRLLLYCDYYMMPYFLTEPINYIIWDRDFLGITPGYCILGFPKGQVMKTDDVENFSDSWFEVPPVEEKQEKTEE